jgi:hypothetical protein
VQAGGRGERLEQVAEPVAEQLEDQASMVLENDPTYSTRPLSSGVWSGSIGRPP